uniref:YSIRK-type signal peptide-containing protein n=1 Tax=Streptococcus sp. 1621 TaxID=2582676 RepID=UPI001F046BAE
MKLKSKEERKGEKVFRYSIRKYHFGAASVAVAALMFFANGTVQAQTPDISPATESGTTRTSDLVSDSSGGVSEELSEKTPDTDPSQQEQSSQGNQKPQEASDENKSLVKDSEEGKGEKQAEEASRPTVDKSLAQSAQTSLQALLTNLTLDSMKELHARVEAGLAQAKAVLENPNSSQEEVNAQVQALKSLTEEVNKALAGGLTSPAELGEGSGATQSEASPTPRRGRGRRGPLTPPAIPAPVENQETKETAEEATDYTNGQGSYPLSDKIHKLLQELKTSTENPEQVQKLKEAYDKLNEALQTKEDGLVDQEVFNAALEEYKKATQLKNGVEKGISDSPKSRKARASSSLRVGKVRPGRDEYSNYPEDTIGDYKLQGYGVSFKAMSDGKTIREISITGIEGLNLTVSKSGEGTSVARLKLTGDIPRTEFGVRKYTVKAVDSSGHEQIYQGVFRFPIPKASFITTNKQLEGKAGTIPQDPTYQDVTKYIQAKLPGPVNQKNVPDGAEIRVYLVRGGRNYDGYDVQIPHARGFQKISDGLPNSQGVVTFTPDRFKKYGVDKLGTDELKLVAMIVRSGTDTPLDGEGAISLLSDTAIRATVDKSDL